ncbi:hypothetical protein FY534_13755 (plasmid) [Alicyclobacillus sp. TC]|uniref:Uncharacterized protein n=1 Tax=Alicyclobacillus tolerans TaxID=90970 RepID=A0ABT9LYJ0_9BACL|nr:MULTISPECIES: hypothetical protein [Alicyclobacillus]MDP9729343.1 hypothetical protein [Alicyclobacillus tengchongensis]QRF24845.1 hypothetical protein FY534_13755 [Alicyclobacillus sp. TC]
MMKTWVAHADIIVEFLLGSESADPLVEVLEWAAQNRARVFVDAVAIAECCRMLQLVEPTLSHEAIANALIRFLLLPGVRTTDRDRLLNALEAFASSEDTFPQSWSRIIAYESKLETLRTKEQQNMLEEDIDHVG